MQASIIPLTGCQLSQCLRHKAGMKTYYAVAHLGLDFSTGYKSRNGVHNNYVNRAGANKGLGDFQCLLAGIRLGDKEAVDIHAEGAGIGGIKCVLRVHEGDLAALLLCGSQNMKSEGGLTGGLGAVYLNNSSSGHAADTKGNIQSKRAGGNSLDIYICSFTQTHDGALAVGALDLRHCGFKSLFLIGRGSCGFYSVFLTCSHIQTSFQTLFLKIRARSTSMVSFTLPIHSRPAASPIARISSRCPMPHSKTSQPPGLSAFFQFSQIER